MIGLQYGEKTMTIC